MSTRFLRTAGLALLLGAVLLAATLAAGRHAERRALHAEGRQAHEQLGLYAGGLQRLIDRYRMLPAVLALDPDLQAALQVTADAAMRQRVNLKLERINQATQASTLTLIDRHGIGAAASNWRQTASNVGFDYSFRPYFREARASGAGRFYGVGVTTGQPGYFLSQAIVDGQGGFLGAVAVKLDLQRLEREWGASADTVVVSDAHGVVILANRPDWRYRLLAPLGAADRAGLAETRQYAGQPLLPLRHDLLEDLGADGRRVRIAEPAARGERLWQSLPLPAEGWTLHLLRDTARSAGAGRVAALAAAGTGLALLFLGLFLQQRLRLERLRRRSREELEQMLRQHADALRTAQDEVVQAVERARAGQGASLEHLPQGVAVIDADLRLVAWNRRYVELFRYPPELVQAGRPIEDLLRHNARRGLLGPGAPEDAIQRRLEHLRARRAHMHERERPDGTVLEIRGTPLPDGGFVTSYADITAYKNAARDLRTLAESLERRIEQRTHDLAEAKAEAERANRSKSRFVAAVVHDLAQPLHAARLFLSSLREPGGAQRQDELLQYVDAALSAQDDILASLMDISRLEAGQLAAQPRDFALAPLLRSLAAEAGVLAAARGLRLRARCRDVVVHSDEALLRRILQNFLSNALRYSRRSRILLGLRRAPGGWRIEVWDTGPGIPEEQRQAIFEEFRRYDRSNAGAGLGLAIVERIARLLGHPIGLRSWPGRGSAFSVTVPAGTAVAPAVAAAAEAAPPPLLGRRCWCVEDDAAVREATAELLRRWGAQVQLCSGTGEARALQRREPRPDLLLLDYRLADGDGLELLAVLREAWGAAPPTILVSAEPDPGLRDRAAEAGAAFLSKPLKPAALRALLGRLLPLAP
ncbi:hybrid sensor histidine kinase/response regulator [Solimonas sp. K1W22B-7]|uniref:hybrid sensor histidine kinase/response regulator n=1 Tax=Solimonas sp. K1W22B-7 TaxID=2303331 RepID=UPI001F08F0C6|nr:hybrid sensor histidine kinase/response regulator [Solimonas sp. K1W22B-7]